MCPPFLSELTSELHAHAPGVAEHPGAAAKAVDEELGEEWALGPFYLPPTVPIRALPRDVIMQQRSRVVDDQGTIEDYEKPRITLNPSAGPDSVMGPTIEALTRDFSPAHRPLFSGFLGLRASVVRFALSHGSVPSEEDVAELRARCAYPRPRGQTRNEHPYVYGFRQLGFVNRVCCARFVAG